MLFRRLSLALFLIATVAACGGSNQSSRSASDLSPQNAALIPYANSSPPPTGTSTQWSGLPAPVANDQCPQVKSTLKNASTPRELTAQRPPIRMDCGTDPNEPDAGAPLDPNDPVSSTYGEVDDPGPDPDAPPDAPPTGPSAQPSTPQPFVDPPQTDPTIYEPFFMELPDIIFMTSGGNPATLPVINVTDVSLAITSVGSSDNGNIPTAGHLYVTFWYNGIALGSLQAGLNPPRPGQDCHTAWGCLGGRYYPDDAYGDAHSFLHPTNLSSTTECIIANYNHYQSNKNAWLSYNPLAQNSNSFADALLFSCGYSQSNLSGIELGLTLKTGLIPYAAIEGPLIAQSF